ncbi:hypothetical protein TA3x_004687 [Tundrisphaera sp. TA3]|uniref:hypothetical protein n=1 Tax=Tundrisphaera sp. TA3 TaxID=3435775 RepID=UPI003EBA3814
MFASAEAQLKALGAADAKGKAENQALREVLEERKRRLLEWKAAARIHHEVEHPEPSPDLQAAEARADLEKCRAILEQMIHSPDQPLPAIFRDASGKTSEARLLEMKEAIDSVREQLKEQSNRLDVLRAESNRAASGENAALRAKRDQLHQDFSTVTARRVERESAVASAASPEARDLAAERLANFEWEARTIAEKLDTQEARITLAAKRLDVSAILVQAAEARVHLSKKLLDRMEEHYTAFSEAQRKVLQQAVALEQTRAAVAGDPILKHRSKKNALLLALESQVVAYEKAQAASEGLSQEEQDSLADAAETAFAGLKKLVDDGNLSTLDALRLKNEYRRIGPERDRICQTDLVAAAAEMSLYENALSEAEVDMINDSRDDRLEYDSLLEKVGPSRLREAQAMLDELEAKHDDLLNRRRDVLQKLAIRAEAIHTSVKRRIRILDQQNAFIQTHIFWVRDVEPIGRATFSRARGETARIIRATASLAGRSFAREHLKNLDVRFAMAITVAIFLPLPLWFGRRWIDRYRLNLLS